MEMYGSAVVEHLVTVASGHICGWADQNGMVALPHYSPGYSGWDISDQIKLWELIRQKPGRDFPGDIQVLDTGMLRPKEIAFGGVWYHAAFGHSAEPGDIGSLRKLLAAALSISARAVSAFAAAN